MGAAALLVPARAPGLALDPFLSPSPEAQDSPAVISMTNDSFGPGPVTEWDDLDSFGLRFSAPAGPVRILAAMSGLTDRTDTESLATRLDEMSLGAAFSLLQQSPVRLSFGVGVDATGNFGGQFIQGYFHSGTDVARPVPTAYSGGFSLLPLVSFKMLLSSDAELSPYLVTSGRASLWARGSLMAVAGLRYARPGALLALGGGWRLAEGSAPSTLLAVDNEESGPYIGLETRVGVLALAFEYSPLYLKSNGSLGFALGAPASTGASPPLSLDLGFILGNSVAQRVRLAALLHGGRKEIHEEAYLAFSQGYFSSPVDVTTATMFSEYSVGGAVGVPFADGSGRFELGAGPFVSLEELSTDTLVRSQALGHRGTFGLAAEAGLRVALPFEHLPLGIGWRVRWRALQAELEQTGTSFPARGPLDFEVFAFSQD